MVVDERLLRILACPRCKGPLDYVTEPSEELRCRACRLAYPVRDDIPVMLIEEARNLEDLD